MNRKVSSFDFKDTEMQELSIEKIISLIDISLKNNNIRFIEKIVYGKHFRPKSIEDQYSVLRYIGTKESLKLNLRIFAIIASAHKAVELLNEAIVNDTFILMDSIYDKIDQVEVNEKRIREDRHHLFFSFHSVYAHLCIFSKKFDRLIIKSNLSYDYISKFNFLDAKLPFFQTCTNIARCICFYLIGSFINEKSELCINDIIKARKLLKNSMTVGLLNSDTNHVKHLEFIRDHRMLDTVCQLENSTISQEKTNILKSLEDIFNVAIRNENIEKVKYLKNIFKRDIYPLIISNLDNNVFFQTNEERKIPDLQIYDKTFILNDADVFRDIAFDFEKSGDILTAYNIMKKALILRPTGTVIKQKLAEYKKILAYKKRSNFFNIFK